MTLPNMTLPNIAFPNFELKGKVALVTGAARGLGAAISLALAHAGADVALGLRDVNAPGDVAGQIAGMGCLIRFFAQWMRLSGISDGSTSW
jgi:NAD(P)-dependent dehydrogenase (short-subunit alcohol dehydrogenase family)